MDTGILPTFCYIHDVWPWAGHLISLNLNPLLCIMGDNSIYLIVLFLMIKWIISNQMLKLRASLIAQLVKIWLQCRRPQFDPWVGKICWRRDRLPTPVFLGFPCGSAGKESCNVRDLGSIPGLGRSPGEGKGYSFHYSGLENSMDYIAHGVTKSWTQLSKFHFTFKCLKCCLVYSKLPIVVIWNNKIMTTTSSSSCYMAQRIRSFRVSRSVADTSLWPQVLCFLPEKWRVLWGRVKVKGGFSKKQISTQWKTFLSGKGTGESMPPSVEASGNPCYSLLRSLWVWQRSRVGGPGKDRVLRMHLAGFLDYNRNGTDGVQEAPCIAGGEGFCLSSLLLFSLFQETNACGIIGRGHVSVSTEKQNHRGGCLC